MKNKTLKIRYSSILQAKSEGGGKKCVLRTEICDAVKIFLISQNKKVGFAKQNKGNYIKISPNFLVNTTNLC